MKYAALILNGVAVLLLGWTLYAFAQLAQANLPVRHLPVLEMNPLPQSLNDDQQRIGETLGAIGHIQSRMSAHASAPLALVALPAPGVALEGSVQMPGRSLSLYLDDYASETQKVVIDDRLLRQGGRLEGGGRVAQIKPNKAVIVERLGRQELALPVNQVRVGTLRWADGSPASISTKVFNAGVPGSPAQVDRPLP